MNEESLVTDILGHLEAVNTLAEKMSIKGLIAGEEFHTHFDKPVTKMEAWIESVRERLECIHESIDITSAGFHRGSGTIEVDWVCRDCGTKMQGQLDMYDLWHHNTTPNEIQADFERVM